ncbi:MAG: NifB/NifX family molybdenum-iron cluster-binding protein [Kiritimatiellae bacterium]|nr:NifB/NifX family molybdenum-iron cluster-binding protein [Kiritimatiellia bacterium]
MKILVTAKGREMTDEVDPRFGRAKFFIIVDTDTNEVSAHDNSQNLNAAQGAGIQAAQGVVRLGAEAVISGNVGPNAFQTLNAAGVKMYLCPQATVEEAVNKFKAGELKEVSAANVQGHWN